MLEEPLDQNVPIYDLFGICIYVHLWRTSTPLAKAIAKVARTFGPIFCHHRRLSRQSAIPYHTIICCASKFDLSHVTMKFSALCLTASVLLGTASARRPMEVSIKKPLRADSSMGRQLLYSAVVLKPSKDLQHIRRMEDGQGYAGYQYGDNEYGLSDLAEMYIKYKGCSSFLAPDQEGGNSGDANVNYYNYQQAQQGYEAQQQQQNNANVYYNDGMVMQNLVLFTLCSDSSCGSCSGEYASDMREFLNAYTEMQMRDDEYQCEYVREHCYCQNGNNEYCYSTCYANAGLDNCMQEYYGEEAFQLQEYIECQGKSR